MMAAAYCRSAKAILVPIATLSILGLSGCLDRNRTPASRVYYHGPKSDHFDGAHFFNPEGEQGSGGGKRDGVGTFLRIAEGRGGHHTWPSSVPVVQTVPPLRVEGGRMLVTWIGHATTLVQTQGVNILIDPVWAWRDSPLPFVGPKRVREPGVKLTDLPPIDIVLISHNHYDHLDIGALKEIERRDHPLIVTGLGNDTLLAEHGLKATAGDWGQSIPYRPGIAIEITRAHHWSAHWYDDIDRALWCGFRVELPGGDVYFAGDSGDGKMAWASEVAREGRPIRLALLPIAPYKLTSPQTGNHMDPDQAVDAFRILRPAHALAVHWGTFELGAEAIGDAPVRLGEALRRNGIAADRFRAMDAGQSWDIPGMEE
ncbi:MULTISPECIES: MBL fold metallo-hydrolase [unclassified Novosphingobium]|uniref:MBL fold metallo-hydrolase n=1 Tax=unclassified Novosphingobium TaxID=2644732 RepID=UPI001F3B8190|nr:MULTISPECIES: MBL fold metallo-hydrolase [unclassified Novosphingobium]